MNKVQKARIVLKEAKAILGKAMVEQYPIGAITSYRQGRYWIPCVVIDIFGYQDSVKVRSHTGKEFLINGHRLEGSSKY